MVLLQNKTLLGIAKVVIKGHEDYADRHKNTEKIEI